MPHQLFRNLHNAINTRNMTKAKLAANAILRHYKVNQYTVNKGNMDRVIYALRLFEFQKQIGNAAHNLSGPMLWNLIRHQTPRSRL